MRTFDFARGRKWLRQQAEETFRVILIGAIPIGAAFALADDARTLGLWAAGAAVLFAVAAAFVLAVKLASLFTSRR